MPFSMTHNPPKRAPKPTPDHIALVVRGHVQRRSRFEVEAEMMNRKMIVGQTVLFSG